MHARKDGNHNRDLCAYCKRVRHQETMCMDKFMGKPKGQKAAATVERDDGELELSPEVSQGTPSVSSLAPM
jgi:hypothetical protein